MAVYWSDAKLLLKSYLTSAGEVISPDEQALRQQTSGIFDQNSPSIGHHDNRFRSSR